MVTGCLSFSTYRIGMRHRLYGCHTVARRAGAKDPPALLSLTQIDRAAIPSAKACLHLSVANDPDVFAMRPAALIFSDDTISPFTCAAPNLMRMEARLMPLVRSEVAMYSFINCSSSNTSSSYGITPSQGFYIEVVVRKVPSPGSRFVK